MYPEVINDLIESFKKFPGVGQKSAERMAFSVVENFDEDDYDSFSNSIINAKTGIRHCNNCNSLTDKEICDICSDKTRDKSTLIVVENFKDVFLLEKMGNYNGYYHVLGGLISPFDEIGPEDIHVDKLIKRVEDNGVKEIVFVIKSGIEADTTILYIKKMLDREDLKISKVANGIPVGADMDYIDALTLESALNKRKEVLFTLVFLALFEVPGFITLIVFYMFIL